MTVIETLETRVLLGYTIETFSMEEFKKYYDDNTFRFSDFSRSAFLKAISIPPSYFMEQPEETQDELLCNKVELVKVAKKYAGQSVIVISQGNEIINAGKIKTEEIEIKFEQLASIEDVESIAWDRTFHKDGYISGYKIVGDIKKEGYNRAIFVDVPLLFNKPAKIHEGFIELANPKMDVEKDMIYYTSSEDVSFFDYQHIGLAIEDKIDLVSEDDVKPLGSEESTMVLKESTDIVCGLIDAKVAPKSLMNSLIRYLDNKVNEGKTLTTDRLVTALITFDNNVKSLKLVNALRDSKEVIEHLFTEEEEGELIGV